MGHWLVCQGGKWIEVHCDPPPPEPPRDASVDGRDAGDAADLGLVYDATDVSETEGDGSGPVGRSCAYQGKAYPHLTSWWAADGCNECTCLDGHVGCAMGSCPDGGRRTYACEYDGTSHASASTFPARDGCNLCECAFFWYRDNPPGPILVSCTARDCSSAGMDAGAAIDAGTDGCVHDGKTYPFDTYFPSVDGCDECHCRADGLVTCTFQHIGCRKDAGTSD